MKFNKKFRFGSIFTAYLVLKQIIFPNWKIDYDNFQNRFQMNNQNFLRLKTFSE